jgi:hypothetical protein
MSTPASSTSPLITFVTLHVRQSHQAVCLAAATVAAAIAPEYRTAIRLVDSYLSQSDATILDEIFTRPGAAAKCVSFSLYVWNKQRVINIARLVREQAPETILLVGGPEATACWAEITSLKLFDRVIAGEGELVIEQIVSAIANNQPLPTIGAPQQERVLDLQQQISPWLSGVLHPQSGVLWETSRGCPFQCAFCYDARGSHGVREIPFSRLEQELQLFVESGVSQIWILDSTFNYPPERGKRLLKLLAKYAPHIHFHLEAKAEFIDEETVYLLQQIYCSLQVGLQSARPAILKQINRALDLDKFTSKVQLLSDAGITFGIDLIYALPGDDYAGLRHSLNYALQFSPNQIEIFPLAILPGTKLFDTKDKYAMQVMAQPPYSVISTASMPVAELLKCRILAAASDLFYNTGRSMAYFIPLCQACALTPVDFLEKFTCWLGTKDSSAKWWEKEWSAQQSYLLQIEFVPQLFHEQGIDNLSALALDLINFNTCWADTLLGEETLPIPEDTSADHESWLHQHWQLATSVRIEKFNYAIDILAEQANIDLIEFCELEPPCSSTGLFIRRGEEVFCESIDEIMATLLLGSNASATPAEILSPFSAALSSEDCSELLAFAVTEGLLVTASSCANA